MSNLALFTPLMRQTVGFDRFSDLFESLMQEPGDRFEAYPPYNIEKTGEDAYRITLAVAGFGEQDLDITTKDDQLIVSGRIVQEENEEQPNYLHRGIAARSFQRSFRLADYIRVEGAELKDGLLAVHLVRVVPEEKKPRMIPINGTAKGLLAKSKK